MQQTVFNQCLFAFASVKNTYKCRREQYLSLWHAGEHLHMRRRPHMLLICCETRQCGSWESAGLLFLDVRLWSVSLKPLYVCACTPQPCFIKHKVFSSPANLPEIDLISPLKEGEWKHGAWIWAFSQHGMKGELPLALRRAEARTWFPDVWGVKGWQRWERERRESRKESHMWGSSLEIC